MGQILGRHFFLVFLDRQHTKACHPCIVSPAISKKDDPEDSLRPGWRLTCPDARYGNNSVRSLPAVCCQLESQNTRLFLHCQGRPLSLGKFSEYHNGYYDTSTPDAYDLESPNLSASENWVDHDICCRELVSLHRVSISQG